MLVFALEINKSSFCRAGSEEEI